MALISAVLYHPRNSLPSFVLLCRACSPLTLVWSFGVGVVLRHPHSPLASDGLFDVLVVLRRPL